MLMSAKETTQRTFFAFLDEKQRIDYRAKWYYLMDMITKWSPGSLGKEIKVFANKKALESEISDLEDISLAAYRAMKLLRKQLAEGSRDDDEQTYSG